MNDIVPEWVHYLVEAGRWAPSADNSQPWHFVFDGSVLTLGFGGERGNALGRNHPANLLGMGTVEENLVQAAKEAGIDIHEWSFSSSGEHYFLRMPEPLGDQKTSMVVPSRIRERHTNRGPFESSPLVPELVQWIESQQEGGCHALVFREKKSIESLAELVRRASELRFRTREIHLWLADSLRFTPGEIARGEGLDINTLSLPPGGVLLSRFLADWRRMELLNRFGAYKLLGRIEASQLTRAGAVVAIVADGMATADWISAGRLLERLWIETNARGLAVHPYFVLSDQLHRLETGQTSSGLRPEAGELAEDSRKLFSGNGIPLMLFRVGRAKQTAVRSRRLPWKSIFTKI